MCAETRRYTLVILGAGALGSCVAREVSKILPQEYQLLGVWSRKIDNAKRLAEEVGCNFYTSIEDIILEKPDYIVEAATLEVFKEVGKQILANGIHLIPLSVGALAEQEFYHTLKTVALKNNSHVYVPSGAVGGFDVLQASKLMEEVAVSITTEKSPKSLNTATFLKGRVLSEEVKEEIFQGTAMEAIKHFPKNVNVAVATALATTGVENTKVKIYSVPDATSNKHIISLKGKSIQVTIEIEAKPSEDNPSSSTLAAYSVIYLLKNLASPIRF